MSNDNPENKPDVMAKPGAGETLTQLAEIKAPFNKRDIRLYAVDHESGLRMLRMNIREGRRFTILDIDAATARKWAAIMGAWADTVDETPDSKDSTGD